MAQHFHIANGTSCYYRGDRYPPGHKREYQLKEENWRDLFFSFLLVVTMEVKTGGFKYIIMIILFNWQHCLMLLTGFVAFSVSDFPFSVKEQLNYQKEQMETLRSKPLEEEYLRQNRGERRNILAKL